MPWRLRAMALWLAGGAFIAIGFGVLSLPGGPAGAQGPTVAFDPDEASILVDDTIDVEITISEVTNLYSASVHVTFDPGLLEVVDADPARDGVQIFPGTFPGPSEGPGDITTNAADNVDGTIDYDFTLLDPAPPAEGSGTLATIRFLAGDSGVSPLTVAAAALWDPYNDPIEADTVDGTLEVDDSPTDTPTPTATPTTTETPSSVTPTRTATSTGTPQSTSTPRPTATEEEEEEEEEETAIAQPPQAPVAMSTPPPSGAAAPVSANAAPQDLPSAGDPALPTQLWRWFFLLGAVILGLATWAFSFRFYARQKEHERFWHGT